MRGRGCVFFVVTMLMSHVAASAATDAVVMPAKGDTCKSNKVGAESASEFSEWQCPGPAGYSIVYSDSVMFGAIGVLFRGKNSADDSLSWAPTKQGLGSRIEWRLTDGRPVAAIVGRWRRIEGVGNAPEQTVEELLVIKVAPTKSCTMASFGAIRPEAMANARNYADRLATIFRCGKDKALVNTDIESGAAKLWDAGFNAHEILDHNGSIVELKRSRAGIIEIRYKEPRAALTIKPGTLLFRGAEHGGEVTGEAFVFKTGCAPASYEVRGRRVDGTLSLSGIAPRRGSGCTIIGASKSSAHANLGFDHEPVIEASTSIALKEPVRIAECGKCMSATVAQIDGVGTERARMEAAVTPENIRDYCENWQPNPDDTKRCIKEYQGDVGKTQRASADCKSLTIAPSSGGQYRYLKTVRENENASPWTDLRTGKQECLANSCNDAAATYQFGLLCPSVLPSDRTRRIF